MHISADFSFFLKGSVYYWCLLFYWQLSCVCLQSVGSGLSLEPPATTEADEEEDGMSDIIQEVKVGVVGEIQAARQTVPPHETMFGDSPPGK